MGSAPSLVESSVVESYQAEVSGPSISLAVPPVATIERDEGLARVQEVVLRLEEDRREFRSELSMLRQIAEELREALIRIDERDFNAVRPDCPPPVVPRPEPVFPAGSIGVEVRVSALQYDGEVEHLKSVLALRPEVDSVRITRARRHKARLRVCLRLPVARRSFFRLLREAAPAAVLLPEASPGSVSMQLHPS
jgi:hypothetical protein